MTSKFRTSIVIPSYCSWATLPNVLDALGDQLGSGREVILVDSSPDAESRLQTAVERWPWLTAVALDERTSPGKARNLGANRAQGELLAFLDADAMPEPGWLAGLEQALGPEHNVVAGAVANGTPQSPVGTAGYLLEFSAWLPGGRALASRSR